MEIDIHTIHQGLGVTIKATVSKIVELTHPDKAEDQEDIFRKATSAYKEENLAILLEIASELRIKIKI